MKTLLLILALLMPAAGWAADQKLSELDRHAAPDGTELIYVVLDPDGSPISKAMLLSEILGETVADFQTLFDADSADDVDITGVIESKMFCFYGTGAGSDDGRCFWTGSDNVPRTQTVCNGTLNGCDNYDEVAAGKKRGFKDSAGNIDIEYDETTGVFAAGTGSITANTGDSATSFFSTGTLEAARLPAATDSAQGAVELAIASELNTGTDAVRAVTPDALAGSNFGTRVIQSVVFAPATTITTGDGKAYIPIPAELNGMLLVGVSASVVTVSSSGPVTIDLARCATAATGNQCSGTVVDMLSTNLTVDQNENKSSTAAAAVIDTSNDDLTTDYVIRVDVDAAGTGAAGLIVTLSARLP